MSIPDLDEPLPEATRAALIESIATAIERRGLTTPARFFLEIHRPLGTTAAHGIVGLTPLIGPVVGAARLADAARLLAQPGAVDALIARLEARPPLGESA